jgi:hypothetical protein
MFNVDLNNLVSRAVEVRLEIENVLLVGDVSIHSIPVVNQLDGFDESYQRKKEKE